MWKFIAVVLTVTCKSLTVLNIYYECDIGRE